MEDCCKLSLLNYEFVESFKLNNGLGMCIGFKKNMNARISVKVDCENIQALVS